jgi:hypothetical protein
MSDRPLVDAIRERKLLKLWRRWRAGGGIIGFLERHERILEILESLKESEPTRNQKCGESSPRYIA